MSGWISGWFKGGAKGDAQQQQQEQTAAAATGGSVETADEIREKRLRRLQAASDAAAAAAAQAEEATKATQQQTAKPAATASTAAKPAAAPAATSTVPAAASLAVPAAASAAATASASPARPATASGARVQSTPPVSPAAAAAAKKVAAASPSPAAASQSGPASPVRPSHPSIHALPGSVFASLRSPLPPSLLLGYTAGAGVTPDALSRAWDHAAFCDIFGVTLDVAAAGSRHAGRVFLKGLAEELMESAADDAAAAVDGPHYEEPQLLIHRELLDSVLMGRLTQQHERTPGSSSFGWLVSAYRRGQEVEGKLKQGLAAATSAGAHSSTVYPAAPSEWQSCVDGLGLALLTTVRYIGLILSDEEMFQNGAARVAARAEFVKLLCSDSNVSRTLPAGLLDSLVATCESEPEQFTAVFKPVADELAVPVKFEPTTSRLGETMPSMENALTRLHGLVQFFRFAPLARMVTQHPSFLPRVPSGRMLMTVSTLGALLSLGASSVEPAFHNVLQRGQMEVEQEVTRLRTSFSSYQQLCAQLFRNGVRHPEVRESLLQWLASFVATNGSRRRMQWHPFETSTDPLFFNVMHVMLQLSAPIIKKSARADLEKVNLHFLLGTTGQRIDYDPITRVHATLADVKSMRAAQAAPATSFNFVTECWFLTHEIVHLGMASIVRQYTELMQEISRQSRSLQSMSPAAIAYEQTQMQLDQLFAINLATRVHLQDPAFTSDIVAFFDWTALWIRFHQNQAAGEADKEQATAAMAQASISGTGTGAPASSATAASSSGAAAASTTPPAAASAPSRPLTLASLIPEHIVEDLVSFFVYLGRFQSAQLMQLPQDSYAHILDLVLALAAGPFALKNPHLRSSLAEFLLHLLPQDDAPSTDHVFNTHPVMLQKLVPTLLDLYVNCEDGRGMYYQKFTARNQLSTLLEFLWQLPAHKAKLIEVAADTSSGSIFTRFVNGLANDLIYLLDEGLKQLTEIRAIQVEMEQPAWTAQSEEALRERERTLHQSEQSATSLLTLANATVHMLSYLTAEIVTPFVAPEFVERIAHMLDFYIRMLVGDKIAELKVHNPEKYQFKPRELLNEIVGTWLHLAHDRTFLEKVASDERSYKPAIFAKAARILRKRAIMSERSIVRFESLTRELSQLSETLLALDDILGDVPDEFADGLMGTLMQDPVQLPQSKQFVDRSTINRQLMNKKVDPFSNTPLSADMLIEQPKLKEQIAQWIEERKAAWREAKQKEEADATAAADVEEENAATQTAPRSSGSSSAAAASSSVAAAPAPARKSYLDE